MSKKPLRMDKSGHISIRVFLFLRKTRLLKTLRLLHFSIFLHEIFRINVELNFALNLLLGFFQEKFSGQILKFPGRISELAANFFENLFENPNSKLSAKFSSTLILKILWKNIEKCKSLRVLSERVLCESRYGHFCPFLEVFWT